MGEALRVLGAVAGALGVLGLLLAPRSDAGRRIGAAGLALLLASWAALLLSFATGLDGGRLRDLAAGPRGLAAAAGALVLLAAAVLAARAVARRPTAWFVLLGLALPLQVPVGLAGERAILLLPLYAVVALGLAALPFATAGARMVDRRLSGTPLDAPLAAFVSVALVSSLWSPDGREAAVKAAFFLVPFTLLLRLVIAWWPGARAVRALCGATLALAVPVALLAVVQWFTETALWNEKLTEYRVYGSFFRVNSIFYDPNVLGRFLAVAILVALAVALRARAPAALGGLAVLVGLLAAALLFTFSQSSALALIAGLAILAAHSHGLRPVLAALGAAVVVLGIGVVAVRGGDVTPSRADIDRASEGRLPLLEGGLEIWADAPVAGAGLGGFRERYRATLSPEELRRTRVLVSHNAPLTVLSEMGLIGFGILLWLIGAAARTLRRAGAGADALGARVALAALAAILVHSLLYAALVENPYTWVILAAGLTLGARVGALAGAASGDGAASPARGRLGLGAAHMLGR